MRFDTIIRNARIIDGTASPWKRGDIGIKDGTIVAVGRIADTECNTEIDAHGFYASPGFINIHSHLDFGVLATPLMEPSVYQGITTELAGQCGQSIAPTAKDDRDRIKKFFEYQWHGAQMDWSWVTLGDFLKRLEEESCSVNFGMCVGHQTLRLVTMGFECRAATARETEQLERTLESAMRDGAFGMTVGAQFPPGFFSETEELVNLGKVVAQHGGFCAVHMRSEGDKVLEAVAEVIEIGERSGVAVQISHLKASGRQNFGKVNAALRMVRDARERGVDVLVDTQPYGAVGRRYAAEMMWMRSCIPPWMIAEAGSYEAFRGNLEDAAFREAVRGEIEERRSPAWNSRIVDCVLKDVGWDGLVLGHTVVEQYKQFVGKSIAEMSRELGNEPYEIYFQLLREESIPSGAFFFMLDPEDVRTVVSSPFTIPMVDVGYRFLHPRKWGCFPRYLTEYVRDTKLLSLEEAVRKITSFPAGRMGLEDRGLIKEGCWADIVVFDWNSLEDRASFDHFDQHPAGIEHVLVNGVPVIWNGKHTGARPGKVLRRSW